MLTIEKEIWDKGFNYIACIDEVGRGCLAGSVVACAVIMPKNLLIEGVNDSKKLTAKKRDKMYDLIMDAAVAVGIGEMDCTTVDEINIKNATKLAMMQAIANLRDKEGNAVIPDYLLIDAEKLDLPIPQSNIIHGDARCHGIAAASIIAKVTRDRQMEELDKEYPLYSFSKNKGYGTKDHVQALLKFGPIKIHRKTFLKKILNTDEQLNFL
ncbi:Ribonuclease HII [bioreactor metagenome]|jgi:ribonuclease HII|uniref:Ribonuclease HII n=2 Tax=root TaxID=1 RepID=A0A562JI07_9FIRM|nr:ribonuclease HII [Sedimentibacter saalensis]MEA5094426.1 ribonuclease HII [Sedimentibacter saalensis]TWH82485.1 RNase HII [Sedimentibacter saalensis]